MRWEAPQGMVFGTFRIETQIGRGGMSTVYLAEDLTLGRRVALKVLLPELAEDEEFRTRFVRESRLSAALEHPNIVPVYDAGDSEGLLYIAMRFVDGRDLRAAIKQAGHLDVPSALDVSAQVASALDAAHARGLVHRDVKSANILLDLGAAPGGGDHAYLTDFGLARHTLSLSSHTQAGRFMGTLDYCSPEQIQGFPLDGRADVYALTCVLFECLTGVPPFHRDAPVATMNAHLHDPPPAASSLRHGLPKALDEVVAAGMAKSKDERPAAASMLVAMAASAVGLIGAGTDRISGRIPATVHREERRLVTVMACELIGSHAADPEDARAAQDRFGEIVREEVTNQGGVVESLIRREAVAVFGAPIAHEDDVHRCIRAALKIAQRCGLEGVPGSTARIGIDTGEALVDVATLGQGEGAVSGAVTDGALRARAAAAAGEVRCGEATVRGTRVTLEWGDVVDGYRAAISQGIDRIEAAISPFVGRGDELAVLHRIWSRVGREFSPQLVTVVGEPGAGKTRLMSELIRSLPKHVLRLGHCLPSGEAVTFWSLGEIVKAEAGIAPDDEAAIAADRLAAAVARLTDRPEDREWLCARLGPLIGLSDAEARPDRDDVFAAWLRFFEIIAADRPSLVLIEDLHWADDPLLEFLSYMAAESDAPILVAATARPEIYDRHPDWGGGRNATSLSLPPLTTEETAVLLEGLLGDIELADQTSRELRERAGGNPLYAGELARMLHERVAADESPAEVAASLPETLHALIAARLDALEDDQRSLLQDAAVVGREFSIDAVAAVSHTDQEVTAAAFRELAHREFVRRGPGGLGGERDTHSFSHALVRDVAYAQIPRGRRAERHEAVADWLEATSGDRLADRAEALAHHCGTALALRRSAGSRDDLGALVDRTGRFEVMAGDRSMNLDARTAERHYRAALDLLGDTDRARGAVLAELAEAVFAAGRLEEANELFAAAIAAARAAGDRLTEGRATVRLATVLRSQGDVSGSYELRLQALPILEAEPPSSELATAYVELAGDRWVAGRFREATDWTERAMRLVDELGLVSQSISLLHSRGGARLDAGDGSGLDDLREALQRALTLGLGPEASLVYNNLGDVLMTTDGPRASLAVLEEGREFSARRRLEEGVLWIDASSLPPLFELDRWDEVVATGDRVLAICREQGHTYLAGGVAPWVALVHLVKGATEEAGKIMAGIADLGREMGESQLLWTALPVEALLAHARLNDRAVDGLLNELAEDKAREPPGARLLLLPMLMRALPLADRVRWIETFTGDLEPVFERHRLVLDTLRAMREEAEDLRGDASQRYLRVADSWAAFGALVEAELCREAAASLLSP